MQQNQNKQINKNSIIENIKLREQVALDLAHEINNFIKIHFGEDAKLIKDEDVIERVNNPINLKNYYNTINKDSILDRLAKKSQTYQEDLLYKGDEKSARNKYILMDLDDSLEADEKNQTIVNYSNNKETAKLITYELIDKYEKINMANLFPINDEEAALMDDDALIAGQIGFGLNDQLGTLNHDKTLQDRMEPNSTLYQTNFKTAIDEINESIISILLPYKNYEEISYTISTNKEDIFKNISAKYKNVKEFENKKLKEELQKFSVCGNVGLLFEENKKIREMIDAGIAENGICTKYYFTDKNGNIAKFNDVLKHFKDGKLEDGYTKVYWTEKEISEYNDKKQGAIANAKAVEIKLLAEKLAVKCDSIEEGLKEIADEFTLKYNEFCKENENAKNDLEKYQNISRFMKENEDLVKGVNDYKKAIFEEKKREFENNKLIFKQNIESKNVYDMKLSYKNLSKYAETKTNHLRNKEFKDNIETYPNKDKWNKMTDFKHNDRDCTHALNNTKPIMSEEDCLESIAMIQAMALKDKEYNDRGAIGKWWYKNSHNKMMQTRETLINDLVERGVKREELNKLGKDDSIKIGDFTAKSLKVINRVQNNVIHSIDKYYDLYIDEPIEKINELKEKAITLEEEKEIANKEFEKAREELYDKFVKSYPDLFKDSPNMTGKDLANKLQNKDIHDKFVSWRQNELDEDSLKTYNEVHSKLNNKNNEIKVCNEEINYRNDCIDNKKCFDSRKFNDHITEFKKQLNGEKVQDRIANQLKNEDKQVKIENVKDDKTKEKELDPLAKK